MKKEVDVPQIGFGSTRLDHLQLLFSTKRFYSTGSNPCTTIRYVQKNGQSNSNIRRGWVKGENKKNAHFQC